MAEAYIVAAARTAGGRNGGRLAGWHPADLAASVLDALIERSGAAPDQVEDVIMGCVSQTSEQSNNVARNAIMASKLPESVPGTSIELRSIMSSLAASSSLSAVLFLPPGSRVGTLVFNSDPIPAYVPMTCRSGHAGADNPMPPPYSRVN